MYTVLGYVATDRTYYITLHGSIFFNHCQIYFHVSIILEKKHEYIFANILLPKYHIFFYMDSLWNSCRRHTYCCKKRG